MTRKPIRSFDLNAFSGAFRTESDRACAVLGAALLDARLENLYNRRLQCYKDELLSSSGPIGAFSARIRIARALAWISTDVQYDLDVIRSIRNEFAHNFDHELSFADQSIADKCRNLKTAQILIDANEHAASAPHRNLSASVIRSMGSIFHPPRKRYEISVEMIAQHLDDLQSESAIYDGPNLRDELWELGSLVNLKFTMNVTTTPPKPD
jgi:Mannitol repressor